MIKNHVKELRQNMTDAEQKVWYFLRNRRLLNFKFRRQVPIGEYIVDFLCYEKKLIIELDGGQHLNDINIKKDIERTRYLEAQGYKIIRFFNNDVLTKTDYVLKQIFEVLSK